ncbi:unnamed protein product [Vitrella brassicaformis CCMP3155]|uniref:K Homology domain-containing protein n=2 Tax=Vitrella brassicaformis TaxID=1169539 RepID=A0A0G4FVE7_VITBC|nr:unnamed protein product [Vitrella brassicaformis CCMP3155]|eukprot:CEM18671.1 unnamed protein product [Vitrella brassicaformis CCMP3155]
MHPSSESPDVVAANGGHSSVPAAEPDALSPCPNVEARFDDRPCWYPGEVMDIPVFAKDDDPVPVRFEDGGERSVPLKWIRRAPVSMPDPAWAPQSGERVEVYFAATSDAPRHWMTGIISHVEEGFHFINFPPHSGEHCQQMIFEKEHLRPVYEESPIDLTKLSRHLQPLPTELHNWAVSADGRACFLQVREQAALLQIQVRDGDKLLLLGTTEAIKRAELMLKVHIKHQKEIQVFQERRERRLKLLEERRVKYESSLTCEFEADQSVVGVMIGKSGENLARISKQFGVEIRVLPAGAEGSTHRIVRIFGESNDSVQAARQELEYLSHSYPVERNIWHWMLNQQGVSTNDLKRKTGVKQATYDDAQQCVVLQGKKAAIDDAIMLLDSHKEYFMVYENMNKESEEIQHRFEDLEVRAGPRGGPRGPRGGRGGRGRGLPEPGGSDASADADRGGANPEHGHGRGGPPRGGRGGPHYGPNQLPLRGGGGRGRGGPPRGGHRGRGSNGMMTAEGAA